MPVKTFIFMFFAAGCSLLPTSSGSFRIASFGKARAAIVTGPAPSPVVAEMAKELTNYLARITGAEFPVSEWPVAGLNTIRLGTPYMGKPDEFAFFLNAKNELELTGTPPRGTVYAAYALLEEFGCRFWTPDHETVPRARSLALTNGFRRVEAPAFAPRPVWCETGGFPYWMAKNRLTAGIARPIPEKLGGMSDWSMGETMVLHYLEPKKYFKDHPDWYALRLLRGQAKPGPNQVAVTEGATPNSQYFWGNGAHPAGILVRDTAQVCSTNPDVIKALIAEIRAELVQKPDTETVSIAFNDNDVYCRCRRCVELNIAGGCNNSARCVALANEVARAIAKDYPKTKIVTLAYWINEIPPTNMTCEPNVRVALAHGMYRAYVGALADDRGQVQRLADWTRIAPGGVYIWGYYANFANFMYPCNDLFDMGPNFRLYKQYGVRGVFAQLPLGEFADFVDFRCWLYAKLLWNPDQDEHKLFVEWTDGVCGKGAPLVRAYMDLRLKTRRTPQAFDVISSYQLIEQALAATADDAAAHWEVEKISAGLIASMIAGYKGAAESAAKQGIAIPSRAVLLDRFEETVNRGRPGWRYAAEGRSIPDWIKIMKAQK